MSDRAKLLVRLVLVAALGIGTALLVAACGNSGKSLIPAANAQPLQADVTAVEEAAARGNGNCTETETALLKLDQDYSALPATLNSGLRGNLRQGIQNLHTRAMALCGQPSALTNTTSTTTTSKTTTTPTTTTPAKTESTPTKSEPTVTPPSEEHAGQGGGTPVPEEGQGGTPGEGAGGAGEEGRGNGNGGNGNGGAPGLGGGK